MNTLQVNFPVTPDLAMPEPLQTIFFYITAVVAGAVFIYSLLMSKRAGSAIPTLMVIGAGCAIVLEPLVGLLGHVTHPAEGSIRLFETFTRVIPWHMFFAYVAAFGAVNLVMYPRIVGGNMNSKYVWISCAVSVVIYILLEIYPVQAGLWVYYDTQPLWLWQGMAPLTWSFMNTACEIFGAALVAIMYPYLKGPRQLLVVVLIPMGALMGHLGSGWPMYSIMNSSAHDNNLLLQASGVLTLCLALTVMQISRIMLCSQNK
jgi:hypothetical protein